MNDGARQLKLSDASRQLGIPYQQLYVAVAAGRVPAERNGGGGRWLIKENHLPEIARRLCIPHKASDDSVPVGAAK